MNGAPKRTSMIYITVVPRVQDSRSDKLTGCDVVERKKGGVYVSKVDSSSIRT